MNRKIVVIPIIIAILGLIISLNNDEKEEDLAFHVTLADPGMYQNGIFYDEFFIKPGEYSFRFVPNGDSPQILSISLNGIRFSFNEDFILNGTLHDTGISQYYTWDYDGQKIIEILEEDKISIQINPNGNLLGAISVDILGN